MRPHYTFEIAWPSGNVTTLTTVEYETPDSLAQGMWGLASYQQVHDEFGVTITQGGAPEDAPADPNDTTPIENPALDSATENSSSTDGATPPEITG